MVVDLPVRVAKLYYEEKKTQNEIAELLGISRQKVGRLLKEADELGIINITVVDPNSHWYKELEQYLAHTFGLQRVIVKPVYSSEDQSIREVLGVTASEFLMEVLRDGQTLACSWGRTLLSAAKALHESPLKVDVVQLNGAIGNVFNEINSNELARYLSSKLKGNYYHLNAPGIVDSVKIRDSLMEDQSIKFALEKGRQADVAAIGIGSIDDSPLADLKTLTEEEVGQLKQAGVVGDVALHLINKEGHLVDSKWKDRIIGISLDDLKRIGCVVGVAGGTKKTEAIKAALRGGYMDVLITDSMTAERIRASGRV